MDIVADLKAVWPFIMAVLALVVWLVRLESVSKQNSQQGMENKKASAAAFEKIDAINEVLPVMQSKISVFGSMLKPDKLAEHHSSTARFQAETEKDIERLMDAAKKSGDI